MPTTQTPGVELLTGAAAVAEGEAREHFRRLARPADYNAKLIEATRILNDALGGSYAALGRLQEAMTRSDFPYYLADAIDRELLPAYKSIDPVWPAYVRRTTVRDFRTKKFKDLLGGQEILEVVGEGAPYPVGKVNDADYSLTVAKYGRRLGLSFEAIINDDLGDFRTLPDRLAQAARNTEDYLATSLYATATGPASGFFTGTTAVDNVPLTLDNLSAALAKITARKDGDGNPVLFPSFSLVVPPALEVVANNIVNALEIEVTQSNNKLKVRNWIGGRVKVVVNPWLSVIDTSNKSATTWYVFPEPNAARPGLVLGFLRGHETPDLRVQANQGVSVGGGAIGPEEGSFEDDTTHYRVRHIAGGTTLDPIGTYASTGS